MYTTHPPPSITALELGLPPETHQVIRAATFLLIPAELLYFSVYFRIKNFDRLSGMLTTLSLAAFFFAPWLTPVSHTTARFLQHFLGATATLKLLQLWAHRSHLHPQPARESRPDWLDALRILAAVRFESSFLDPPSPVGKSWTKKDMSTKDESAEQLCLYSLGRYRKDVKV